MRSLLNECVNPRVRTAFPNHEVLTVPEVKWRTLPDAKLTAQAQGQFDVLLRSTRVSNSRSIRIEYYKPIFPALVDAVERVLPGEIVHVKASPA